MTRGAVLGAVAVALVGTAVGTGAWALFLYEQPDLERAGLWSGVLQGVTSLLSLGLAVVFGVLALRSSRQPQNPVPDGRSQSARIGPVKAGRDVRVDVRQDQQP